MINKKLPIFVIQKHAASHLHYDFRLEINHVLKSWAIPKGPSTDYQVKRLAIETTDHPMSYANFSGQIPKGQYGAGSVEIWDHGTYKNLRGEKLSGKQISMFQSYNTGKILVYLYGQKLVGAYGLIRTNYSPNSWLFFRLHNIKDK